METPGAVCKLELLDVTGQGFSILESSPFLWNSMDLWGWEGGTLAFLPPSPIHLSPMCLFLRFATVAERNSLSLYPMSPWLCHSHRNGVRRVQGMVESSSNKCT